MLTIGFFSRLTFALKIDYAGETLGYIADESVFNEAQNRMKERIVYEEYQAPIDAVPQFSLAVVSQDELLTTDQAVSYTHLTESLPPLTPMAIRSPGLIIS